MGIGTTSRYLFMRVFQAALENLFKALKECVRISMKMKIEDCSELFCVAVILSYSCDMPKGNMYRV